MNNGVCYKKGLVLYCKEDNHKKAREAQSGRAEL